MNHDELVYEALRYRRHTGATLGEIRAYLELREEQKHTPQDDRQALHDLEVTGILVRVGKKWFFTPSGYREARGPALKPEWKQEDAWILLAALFYRNEDEVPLWKIIAAADFINHAIPTLEETHGALNRLVAGRLLKAKGETFRVTTRTVDLFDKVQATCRKAVMAQLDGLQSLLACPCCGVRLKQVRWTIRLDAAALDAAVKAYGKSIQRTPK